MKLYIKGNAAIILGSVRRRNKKEKGEEKNKLVISYGEWPSLDDSFNLIAWDCASLVWQNLYAIIFSFRGPADNLIQTQYNIGKNRIGKGKKTKKMLAVKENEFHPNWMPLWADAFTALRVSRDDCRRCQIIESKVIIMPSVSTVRSTEKRKVEEEETRINWLKLYRVKGEHIYKGFVLIQLSRAEMKRISSAKSSSWVERSKLCDLFTRFRLSLSINLTVKDAAQGKVHLILSW